MMRRYTDSELTGSAAVPEPNSTEHDCQRRRDAVEETVWSHRLDTEER